MDDYKIRFTTDTKVKITVHNDCELCLKMIYYVLYKEHFPVGREKNQVRVVYPRPIKKSDRDSKIYDISKVLRRSLGLGLVAAKM